MCAPAQKNQKKTFCSPSGQRQTKNKSFDRNYFLTRKLRCDGVTRWSKASENTAKKYHTTISKKFFSLSFLLKSTLRFDVPLNVEQAIKFQYTHQLLFCYSFFRFALSAERTRKKKTTNCSLSEIVCAHTDVYECVYCGEYNLSRYL